MSCEAERLSCSRCAGLLFFRKLVFEVGSVQVQGTFFVPCGSSFRGTLRVARAFERSSAHILCFDQVYIIAVTSRISPGHRLFRPLAKLSLTITISAGVEKGLKKLTEPSIYCCIFFCGAFTRSRDFESSLMLGFLSSIFAFGFAVFRHGKLGLIPSTLYRHLPHR